MRSIWPCTWMIVVALTVGPRTADAYSFFLSSAQAGAEVHAGEVVTVDVWFDAEGNPDGILAFSVGVDFVPANPPGSVLDYRQDLSSTATYLLYVSAKAPYLEPTASCGGNTGAGCDPWPATPEQINIEFVSTQPANAVTPDTGGPVKIATLVFDVIGVAWGPLIALELDALRGNAFFDGSGTDDDVTLGPALTFGPEPTTATLLGLGLIGLGLMRKRAA